MNRALRIWSALGLILTLVNCAGDGDGGGNFVPVVQVQCATASVADCSLDGRVAYVGLIETLTLDCDDTLSTLSASQRQQLFTVSGSAVTSQAGAYLTGRVTSWVNSTGGHQDVLNPGTYQVCAFIDSNNNGVIDTNEPVGQGQVSTGTGTYILSSWSAAFN